MSGIDADGRLYSFIKKVVVEMDKGKRDMLELKPFVYARECKLANELNKSNGFVSPKFQ